MYGGCLHVVQIYLTSPLLPSLYRVSLPPPHSDMNNTYAVVNKKSAAQGLSPVSTTLDARTPTFTQVQYDNVRPRSSPATPMDQLYSTVVPKSNRISACVTLPSNTGPISSSYSVAGNPTPPEVAPAEYSVVNTPSPGKRTGRGRFPTLWPIPAISSWCCFLPGELE